MLAVLNVGGGREKKLRVRTKNTTLTQASKILPTASQYHLWVKPHTSWRSVGDRISKNGVTCETVKWLKNAKLSDVEVVSVIWIGKVNVKNGTRDNDVIDE